MSSLADLQTEYQRLVAEREALSTRYQAGQSDLLPQIKDLTTRISVLATQIDSLFPRNSSGSVVRDDQLGNGSLSNTQDPPLNVQILSADGRIVQPDTNTNSNAQQFRLDTAIDTGLNGALRLLSETQAISNQNGQGAVSDPGSNARADSTDRGDDNRGGAGTRLVPGNSSAGVGAAGDDRGAQELVSSLNAIDWTDKIVDQSNILSQYASYSYRASLYLMDPATAQRILNTGSRNLGNAPLLVQTGGAAAAGRSDFFSLDYYIDSIELKSFFVGKGTRLAHNVKEGKITILEPNGISFVQNLDSAVQRYFGTNNANNKRNFASQIYMLVIRFYGYDDQGNLVRGGTNSNQVTNETSDPNAFVEKFYPLVITKLDFRIASKAVEYELHFKAPPYYINASQGRGTIPFQYEFSGKTVKDILAGPSTYSAGQNAVSAASVLPGRADAEVDASVSRYLAQGAPANAGAAPTNKATVRRGLMDELNLHQQKLKRAGVIQYADEYNIEFNLDSMANASVILPGLVKGSTSMAQPTTAADQKLGAKQSMDVNTQTQAVIAGTQIVQFIDFVMRRSSYIRDQQTTIIDNKTGKPKNGPGANLRNTTWYRIGFKAVPMLDKYDELRNDYAYKITYTVSPYLINQLNSPYFKYPVFRGVHKSYQYWFTGKNTEVISYEESLNNLYYIALTQQNFQGATSSASQAVKLNEQLKFLPVTASGESTQGGANDRTLEPAANAADQLYSPSDLKEASVTIVGDPAWLQQGEAFVALDRTNPNYFKPFLTDGTINFDAQQVMFEVAFNSPRDYSLPTGLAQPSADRLNSLTQLDVEIRTPLNAQFSRVYIAKECTSLFAGGKFTQNLKGILATFYPPGSREGRLPPEVTAAQASTATVQAAPNVVAAPAWSKPTSVTGQTPTSSIAIGTQQILRPASQLDNPTLAQLAASPVYIQARRNGSTPQQALDAARAAFAAGTNNYEGVALPGIRDTSGTAVPGSGANKTQPIVKDGNPG